MTTQYEKTMPIDSPYIQLGFDNDGKVKAILSRNGDTKIGVDDSMTWATKLTPDKFGVGSAYFSDINETLYCNGTVWEIPKFQKALLAQLPESLKVRKAMATPPTINLVTGTDASDIVSPTKYQFNTPTEVVGSNFCALAMAQNPVLLGTSAPKNLYSSFNSQAQLNGHGFRKSRVAIKHIGQVISFHGYSLLQTATSTSNFAVIVDDEYISLTPTPISLIDTQFVLNIDFGSVAEREIHFISYYCALGGISVAQTDTVVPAKLDGPSICILGDSLVDGAYGDKVIHDYTDAFAARLGYDNVNPKGYGGSRISSGIGNYISRLSTDVNPYAFDVILFQLSVNETVLTSVPNDLRNLLAQTQAANPKALLGVIAPMLRGSSALVSTNWWTAIYACKQIVENEFDGIFLNHYELPLAAGTPIKTLTLRSSAAQAAATINTLEYPSVGSTFKFDDGTHIRVQSASGAAPTVTVTLETVLQTAQASGNVATECGQSLMTGKGYLGATTGFGNGDLFMYSDFKHYTAAGHDAMGQCLAMLYCYEMKRRFGE